MTAVGCLFQGQLNTLMPSLENICKRNYFLVFIRDSVIVALFYGTIRSLPMYIAVDSFLRFASIIIKLNSSAWIGPGISRGR